MTPRFFAFLILITWGLLLQFFPREAVGDAALGCSKSSSLDSAQWAYDKDNHTLRLCVQEQVSERLRCTTFPIQVFIEGERPWDDTKYDL
jgi:hypothetical protein